MKTPQDHIHEATQFLNKLEESATLLRGWIEQAKKEDREFERNHLFEVMKKEKESWKNYR